MNMTELAKRAGVSKTAVSFALNNKPGISQDTRNHILRIAEELNYIPKLKTHKDTIIFSIVTNDHSQSLDYFQNLPFFQSVIEAFKSKSYLKGYNLTLQTISTINDTVIDEWQRPNVYGVVVLGTFLNEHDIAAINQVTLQKLVVLDNNSGLITHHTVGINNRLGMQQIYHQLDTTQSILLLTGMPTIQNFLERSETFHSLARNDALSLTELSLNGFEIEPSSQQEVDSILTHLNTPTIVVAENDYLAMKVANVAHANDLTENLIALYGFDNISTKGLSPIDIQSIIVDIPTMVDVAIDVILKDLPTALHVVVDTKLKE